MRVIDFYFDFMSPFSYLAQLRLPDIARTHNCKLNYCPIEIPEAKIAAGNYGPSNREVAPKLKVLAADLQRWAAKYEVPLVFPASFACSDWNCAALFAQQQGRGDPFVSNAYARIWGLGIDPRDDAELRACAETAGLDADDLQAFVASPEGQAEYGKARSAAYQRGIFGAPLMVVDDEIFWGNDRLEFLEEYLIKN